jgi:hypothetical protein
MIFVGGILAAGAVQAGGARAMSDDEMSQVWGQGLSAPTLQVLTRQDQSASYASAEGALTALSTLTAEGTATLERQAARQQAQAATVGLQETLRLAQSLAAASQLMAPVVPVTVPALPFPVLPLPVPLPPSLGGNDGKKH